MSNELQRLKDDMCRELFGTTVGESQGTCVKCRDGFSSANVYTAAGWRETKISGLCERCFDEMFKDEE